MSTGRQDFVENTSTTVALLPASYEQLRDVIVDRRKLVLKRWLAPVLLILSDVLLALLGWLLASALQGVWGRGSLSQVSVVAPVPLITVWLGVRALFGLYPGYGLDAVEQLRRHTYSTFATLAIVAIFALGLQVGDLLSRLQLALIFLGLLVLTPFARYLAKKAMKRVGIWGKPVVVLGYNEVGANVADLLKKEWALGYDPVAVFTFHLGVPSESLEEAEDQQALVDVVNLSGEYGVNTAVFAMPHVRREQLSTLVGLASHCFRHLLIVPNLSGITNSAVVARDLAGTFAVEIKHNLLNPWALRAKRAFDLAATVVGGTLILPLLLVLALLVYLESGGPVFYKDSRMGKDGKLFSCIKFRTMVSNAEALLQRMLEEDGELREEYSKYHKLRTDPRVTHVGRFLRRASLDELPQLWNVLRGEMSLVGPRPYLPRESNDIGDTQGEILRVPPGITGPWQVAGRNHVFFDERAQMDVSYVRDWSIWLDIVLLARTAKILLFNRGAY